MTKEQMDQMARLNLVTRLDRAFLRDVPDFVELTDADKTEFFDSSHGHSQIMPLLENSGCNYDAIYGKSFLDHADGRAPYLVSLQPDHCFTETLVGQAWGKSWGIFVSADTDLRTLRRHLARLVSIRLEGGRVALFRFYDPRVLAHYLATCPPQQPEAFFGPISSFYLESSGGENLIRLTLD